MDNAYILHTLAEKELLKKGGKLMALFVDLKAAFDSLDREEMIEELKKIEVKGRLLNSIRMIYTRSGLKMKKKKQCYVIPNIEPSM